MAGDDKPKDKTRVILIGVGGATCSGKTTLAKYLRQILPRSFIIHQDDFAPPADSLPIHPTLQVQDWDDAPGAIDWPRLRSFLKLVKETGDIPEWHRSHDHLNEQKEVPMDEGVREKWKGVLESVVGEGGKEVNVVWGIVDGFLLYWDREIVDLLDARIFLRVSYDVLLKRRHERSGYHTADQSENLENTFWRDPPEYFEQVVYPAYVRAHSHMLTDGDVERGEPNGVVERLVLVDGEKLSMGGIFEKACEAILEVLKKPRNS